VVDGMRLSVFNIPIPQQDELYQNFFSFLALSLGSSQHPKKMQSVLPWLFIQCLRKVTVHLSNGT